MKSALPDFFDIAYLNTGSPIQKTGFNLINHSKILYHLHIFDPVLTGTLPLNLFIEGKSDLDILCEVYEFEKIKSILVKFFGDKPNFEIIKKKINNLPTLLCRFTIDPFPFEIFCQPVKVKQQLAYRHMIIEYKLLQTHGESFRKKVLALKRDGVKTEPAFTRLLNLNGDPYKVLLTLESSNE